MNGIYKTGCQPLNFLCTKWLFCYLLHFIPLLFHKMIQIPLASKTCKKTLYDCVLLIAFQFSVSVTNTSVQNCSLVIKSNMLRIGCQNERPQSLWFEHKDDIDMSLLLLFHGESKSGYLWNLACIKNSCNVRVLVLEVCAGFCVWAYLIYCVSLFEHLTFIFSDLSSRFRGPTVKTCQSDCAVLSCWRAFVQFRQLLSKCPPTAH